MGHMTQSIIWPVTAECYTDLKKNLTNKLNDNFVMK